MIKIIVAVKAAFLLMVLTAVLAQIPGPAPDDAKAWPDFSCHPRANTQVRQNEWSVHVDQWNECLEGQNRTGRCAKTCYLRWNGLMYQMTEKEDPLIFDVDRLVYQLADVNQISIYSEAGMAVSRRMAKCKRDHPEIPEMWKYMKEANCTIWEPILKCIDWAYGC